MIEQELVRKLSDLGNRIQARIDDLRERGEFSDVHAAAFAEIRARRDAMETGMEKAVATGSVGSAALIEVKRDVDALTDAFEAALFTISAQAARQ